VESGDRRLGRSESGMWKAGTSKVVVLVVLVMDLSVGPREQVLNVSITCWYMGPVSYPVFMPKQSSHCMHDPGSIIPHIW
jgi:hypothetical protein